MRVISGPEACLQLISNPTGPVSLVFFFVHIHGTVLKDLCDSQFWIYGSTLVTAVAKRFMFSGHPISVNMTRIN